MSTTRRAAHSPQVRIPLASVNAARGKAIEIAVATGRPTSELDVIRAAVRRGLPLVQPADVVGAEIPRSTTAA